MSIKSKEYFPPNSNSIYIYRGFNNNSINFKSSVDYFNNNKIQVRFDNGITNIVIFMNMLMTVLKFLFKLKILLP